MCTRDTKKIISGADAGYRDTATRQICTKVGEGNMDLHVSLDPLKQTTSFGTFSHKWNSSNCPLVLPERI